MDVIKTHWFRRAFPFALYMLFIVISDVLSRFFSKDVTEVWFTPLMYFLKIVSVTAALILFWKFYDEIRGVKTEHILISFITGAVVFVLWVRIDWRFAVMGNPDVFDPRILPATWFYVFIVIRILGASVITPIFEELFWRSFILRYIINPDDFTLVKIGAFSWSSFLISAVLFGLEHYDIVAGIAAGLIYNLLLYRTKNIRSCVIAHGVTNLMLGIYVLQTGKWHFW